MIAVGKIIKPHGIRGDVKAECFMDSPDCFMQIRKISIENQQEQYKITRASVQNNIVILHLKGIDDMNAAELYRGRILYCEESELPQPEEGRFYIDDIIGCTVYAGEETYGKIVDILQYGSADVIVLKDKGKRRSFPWIKELNADVDVATKLFRVDEEKLKEVLLDED